MIGAIEAGGTKFVCAISDETLTIQKRISIPTTTPKETIARVYDFFKDYELEAIGVGSFGPVDVRHDSLSYGSILNTPKLAWQHYPLLLELKKLFDIPIALTTDVNAAAYGELKKGAAKGHSSCIYITVGTGIGAGIVANETVIHGYGHPEAGHLLVRQHAQDTYEGNCPFHRNCLEGMASGPAIEQRVGKKAEMIATDSDVWQLEAYYLAQALMSYTLVVSPDKIILGGGVMKQSQLFPLIHQEFDRLMNGYVSTPPLEEYIVPCELGDNAGIMGCLLLGLEEINRCKKRES